MFYEHTSLKLLPNKVLLINGRMKKTLLKPGIVGDGV